VPVKATVKTVDIAKFKREFTSAAKVSQQQQLEETLDTVLEGIQKRFGEVQSSWSGGEDYRKKEVDVLRKRGLKKLADKRSQRETWPDLKFDIERGYKNGVAWAVVSTDNPLFIWLDRGTDGVQSSPKVKIVPVTIRGTVPGVRKINPTTVANRPFQIQSGAQIAGIDPNNWSKGIAEEINMQFNLMVRGRNPIKVKVEVPE